MELSYSHSHRRWLIIALLVLLWHLFLLLLLITNIQIGDLSHSQNENKQTTIHHIEHAKPDPNSVMIQEVLSAGEEEGEAAQSNNYALDEQPETNEVAPLDIVDDHNSELTTEDQSSEEKLHEHIPMLHESPIIAAPFVPQQEEVRKKTSPSQKTPPRLKRTMQHASQAQTITLADVTRGFVKSLYATAGTSNAAKDKEELVLQRYGTKITNFISRSFCAERPTTVIPHALDDVVLVSITVARDGTMLGVKIISENNSPAMRIVIPEFEETIRKAGKLPPLPSSFNVEYKTFNIVIKVQAPPGTAQWTMNVGRMW